MLDHVTRNHRYNLKNGVNQMSDNLRELENRLKQIKSDTLLEIESVKLGLDYARDRYFEIEQRITNERINRLERTESIVDILLFVAIGGVTGRLAGVVVSRVLGKILSNHLVYVDTFVRIAKKDRDRVRSFLKLPKKVKRIKVENFLNKDSPSGRLYRFLPEYINSRVDETVQGGLPKKRSFWPKTSGVAEFLLQTNVWYTVQKTTILQEFEDIHELLRDGFADEVKTAIDERDKFLVHFGTKNELMAKQLAEHVRVLGECFLLQLFSQRYGPSDRLAIVKDVTYWGLVIKDYVQVNGDHQKLILKILIEELIDPCRKTTYYQYAHDKFFDKVPIDEGTRDIRVKNLIFRKASLELLHRFDMIYKQMKVSPVSAIELVQTLYSP